MKALALALIAAGAAFFIYAVVGRFLNGPTVFGYIMPLEPKSVVLGANTLITLGIAALLLEKK